MPDAYLLNYAEAFTRVSRIEDPVVRNLVLLGMARARMNTLSTTTAAGEPFERVLPSAPFDMLFFSSMLTQMFESLGVVRNVMDGQDLAQASGWDV